jgi:hypothetical protein
LAPDEFVKKVAQNVAQPNFLSKLVHDLFLRKIFPTNLSYFYKLKKRTKLIDRPMGENKPNLVTLDYPSLCLSIQRFFGFFA